MPLGADGGATAVSLAVTAAVFQPGILLGPIFGRVSGTFMAFLLPFLDLGIGQSPMLRGEPATWAHWLPGYGATRVMIDGALTSGFDEAVSLAIGLGWITALLLAASVLLRGIAGSRVPNRSRRAHMAHR